MKLYYIKALKTITGSKTLISNFFSLSIIQAANFVLPLLVIPHLVNVLKVENFGLVSFAQACIQLFIIITDYGFNLSATKSVSLARDSNKKLSEIFNSVIQTKLLLFAICAGLIAVSTQVIPSLHEHKLLFLYGIFMVLGQALIPVWFFQGIEKMKFLTIIHLISKVIFTALIFIFIRVPEDYIYVNLIYGLGSIVAGFISIILVYKSFSVSLKLTSYIAIKNQLKESFPFFISNLSNNIYIYSNIIILKFLSTAEIVGYYSIAEKIFAAAKRLLEVLFLTVYPHACKLSLQADQALQIFFTRFFYLLIFVLACFGAATFIFAEELIVIISGEAFPLSILLLKLLSFAPLIIGLNMPAYQTALIYNYQQAYVGILVFASGINIILNFYFAGLYGAIGTIFTIWLTEIFVTSALNIVIWKRTRYNFFNFANLRVSINGKG